MAKPSMTQKEKEAIIAALRGIYCDGDVTCPISRAGEVHLPMGVEGCSPPRSRQSRH